ncbi:hypothetical protein SMICM17S_12706 [Streptomyces microflavus]
MSSGSLPSAHSQGETFASGSRASDIGAMPCSRYPTTSTPAATPSAGPRPKPNPTMAYAIPACSTASRATVSVTAATPPAETSMSRETTEPYTDSQTRTLVRARPKATQRKRTRNTWRRATGSASSSSSRPASSSPPVRAVVAVTAIRPRSSGSRTAYRLPLR